MHSAFTRGLYSDLKLYLKLNTTDCSEENKRQLALFFFFLFCLMQCGEVALIICVLWK